LGFARPSFPLRITETDFSEDTFMKTLVFLAALAVVGLVVTGAIKMQKTSDNTLSIQVDENLVKQDASRVIEEGREVIEKAEAAVQSSQGGVQK
jgi:hypothetical protein